MEKTEVILRALNNIGLNNRIIELENSLELEKQNNKASYEKTKTLFTELIDNNKKLSQEKLELEKDLEDKCNENKALKEELEYNRSIVNKIPKFLLKFILKNKDIKLLDKGNKENG